MQRLGYNCLASHEIVYFYSCKCKQNKKKIIQSLKYHNTYVSVVKVQTQVKNVPLELNAPNNLKLQ